MGIDELREFVKQVLNNFEDGNEEEYLDVDEIKYAFEAAIDKLERKEELFKLIQEVGFVNIEEWLEEYNDERRYK